MLSCAGADRLQTGMRGAYGKPNGLVSRINIGDPILSIRTKEQNYDHAYEALRRSKMKFPGRQKIYRSKNWGFTKFTTSTLTTTTSSTTTANPTPTPTPTP